MLLWVSGDLFNYGLIPKPLSTVCFNDCHFSLNHRNTLYGNTLYNLL